MAQLRKLGRRTAHRKAMLRNQVTSLLRHGKIETTVMKAKETKRMTDKMITLAKRGDVHARRQVAAFIYDKDVIKKLFDEIAPEYEERNGGYTQIIRMGPRRGDGTEIAIIELV